MRIAFFSDVHANLPALEAILKDFELQNLDMIYCLGDLIGYAPWPNAVIEEIKKRKIPSVSGEHDKIFDLEKKDEGFEFITEEKSIEERSIEFTKACIRKENREYLESLPKEMRLVFGNNGNTTTILLVHKILQKTDRDAIESTTDKEWLNIIESTKTDLLIFGDTHKPFFKTLNYGKSNKYILSTGSVGKPQDGDPRACYVILTFNMNPFGEHPDTFKVEYVRVEYNIERAAKAIEESPIPDECAVMLRRGY